MAGHVTSFAYSLIIKWAQNNIQCLTKFHATTTKASKDRLPPLFVTESETNAFFESNAFYTGYVHGAEEYFALIGCFASTVAKNEFSVKAFRSSFHLIRNGNRTKWSNSVCNHRSDYFASSGKKSHLSARVMARTVQLLRHDACCPITVHAQLRLESGQLIANQI